MAKYFWGVVQKYPTPPIPLCRFVKSIPWVLNMVTHVSDWVLTRSLWYTIVLFIDDSSIGQGELCCPVDIFSKNYKSPGWITFCLFEVKINNIEIFISTSDKLDVIVFGIQFYSQYCRRSRWILAEYFQNEENRPLSIAAHIQRIRSLIMPGRGWKDTNNFVKKFRTPLTFSPKFSCPNKLPGNVFVPQQRSMVPTKTSTASHRSRHFLIFCLNRKKKLLKSIQSKAK